MKNIFDAVIKGETYLISSCLRDGADVNVKDKHGYTLLMYAAMGGHKEIVKLLLKAGANNFDEKNFVGQTAVMIASIEGYKDIVQLLISKGADANVKWVPYMQVTDLEMKATKQQSLARTVQPIKQATYVSESKPEIKPKHDIEKYSGYVIAGIIVVVLFIGFINSGKSVNKSTSTIIEGSKSLPSDTQAHIFQSLYALSECETYIGPSKSSGKFFFKPEAQKSLSLDKNHQYNVMNEQGDWVQVDVFGKLPWVEKKCMADKPHVSKGTLKKGALVCRTKSEFNEAVGHRDDKGYLMNMLINGQCKMLIADAEVPVRILEGVFPMVKIKMVWNDEIFIGWTDSQFINY